MMLNKLIVQGNLVRDPELKTSINGKNYCMFTLACNIKKDKCYFVPFTMFGEQAENFCKWSKKGDMRIIEGEVMQDTYDKNGEKISKIKLIANSFYFAGVGGDPKAKTEDNESLMFN